MNRILSYFKAEIKHVNYIQYFSYLEKNNLSYFLESLVTSLCFLNVCSSNCASPAKQVNQIPKQSYVNETYY